jgi:hypothetical protein
MSTKAKRTFSVNAEALKVLKVYVAHNGGSVNDLVSEAVDKLAERITKRSAANAARTSAKG